MLEVLLSSPSRRAGKNREACELTLQDSKRPMRGWPGAWISLDRSNCRTGRPDEHQIALHVGGFVELAEEPRYLLCRASKFRQLSLHFP